MRVLAAMSGGVDSSVAAARMVDAGHDVVGVHLALSQAPGALRTGSRGCCSKEDVLASSLSRRSCPRRASASASACFCTAAVNSFFCLSLLVHKD